ncbi:hypothetical protein MMC09_002250 [Bachmanniomyces sp. S44760]|nr:hypothetical protein [Bachmanniomyces sp. S44760]
MVAGESHLFWVSLVSDRGARINNRDNQGRIALMAAVLRGRLENPRIVLAREADKEAKDGEGRKTIDFTSQSDKNVGERLYAPMESTRKITPKARQRTKFYR